MAIALGRRTDDYRDVAETARCRHCGRVGMDVAESHGRDGSYVVLFVCPECRFRCEV